MRWKNRKIRGPKRIKGAAHRGPKAGSGAFHRWRVTGDHIEPLCLFAESASKAELVARRILGEVGPYEGRLEVVEAADVFYEGRKEES